MANTTPSPFDALENAILKGQMASFRERLEQAIETSQGKSQVAWPDHALIMVILSGMNKVDIDIQRQMLAAIIASPFPPSQNTSPNPIMEAVRMRSALLDDLLEAGFTLGTPTQEDNRLLIKRLAEGEVGRVDKAAPRILMDAGNCDALLANLLDINRKASLPCLLDIRQDQGQALGAVLAMPVCKNIQVITAKRMLPQFQGDACSWWPITDRLEPQSPLWGGMDLLIEHDWLNPDTLRHYQASVERGRMADFEGFLREIEQRALEAHTPVGQCKPRATRL